MDFHFKKLMVNFEQLRLSECFNLANEFLGHEGTHTAAVRFGNFQQEPNLAQEHCKAKLCIVGFDKLEEKFQHFFTLDWGGVAD